MNSPTTILPRPGSRGMTLIEIMVAMTIFAIVLSGILPLSIYVIGYTRSNARTMQARNVMSNIVEQMRALPPTSAWRTNDSDNADSLNNTASADGSTTVGAYTVRWNIVTRDSSTQQIWFFVNWTANNVAKTMTSSLTLTR